MTRRSFPVVATLLVLIAIGTMIDLGLWQWHRKAWKEAMLARYLTAAHQDGELAVAGVDLPENAAYRRLRWSCEETGPDQVVAGRNGEGRSGWAHVVLCTHRVGAATSRVPVVIGWSFAVAPVHWDGGAIAAIAVPGPKSGVAVPPGSLSWHLVADPPQAGLVANARPDPREIPNNHFGYAVQWFLFALTALVIYAIALRRRFRPDGAQGCHDAP